MADRVTGFPLHGPINLLVRLGHGSLRVAARDGLTEATVRLTPRDANSDIVARTTVEMRGPTLTVSAPRQGGLADLMAALRHDRDAVDAEIEVPSGTALKITTATADVSVTGRCGGADIGTGSASVDLDTVDGDLRLRGGSAASRVRLVAGAAVVRSGAGHAHFGEVAGMLQCGFGSGDLEVEVARAGVRSRAGSGSAHIGAAYGDVDLASGSGQVDIGLPAGVSARLDVTTGSGRVHSDFPVDDARPARGTRTITVRARTGSGDVRLVRAPSAA